MVYSDKNAYALFGVESTFNTPVAVTKDIGVINNISVDETNNVIDIRSIGNRESEELVMGNYDATLSVDGHLNSGAIFELMFGQSTDTLTTADYTHTFVDRGVLEVPDTATSFTMATNFNSTTDVENTYAGCKLNTIDVSLETGGTLDFSAEILGSSIANDTTASTQVTTTTSKLCGFHGGVSTGAEGAEASVGKTKSVSFSITQNIDAADVKEIGSRFSADLVEKNIEFTAEFTKVFADSTEHELFLGGTSPQDAPTDVGFVLDVNNGVTLGSGRVQLYVKVLGGQYESISRTIAQNGMIEETFTYRGGQIDDLYFVDAVATYF